MVEPAKEGADRLKRFFGGRRMLDFRAEENPPTPSGVVSATPQTPEHTHQPHKANASGDKMITMKKISILIIMVGLLLPVVSLGFVDRYNPIRGFIWNISNMEIISIPYGYVLALGGILICLGTAGVLFDSKPIDRISRRDERAGGEQAKTEERKPEIPAENKTSPDVLPDSDLE